jgi:hypothetical protein
MSVESTSVWLNENKNNNEKTQKTKYDPGSSRSKVYLYYDVFKVILWMLMLGFKLIILPPSYEIGLFRNNYEDKISIILKYRFGSRMRVESARMDFESSHMRVKSTRSMVRLQWVIVFQTAAGMCLQLRFMYIL